MHLTLNSELRTTAVDEPDHLLSWGGGSSDPGFRVPGAKLITPSRMIVSTTEFVYANKKLDSTHTSNPHIPVYMVYIIYPETSTNHSVSKDPTLKTIVQVHNNTVLLTCVTTANVMPRDTRYGLSEPSEEH